MQMSFTSITKYTKSEGKSIESILNHVYIGVALHNFIYVYCLAPHGLCINGLYIA